MMVYVLITEAIEDVLKIDKNTENFRTTNFDDLPKVKKERRRIQDANDETTYPGMQITHYKDFFRFHKDDSVLGCL